MDAAALRSSSVAPRPARRDDVQGLRAVASLLVAGYHIWFGTVSGGVDVFFVLGGYLLVTSLVAEVERTGRVDVVGSLRRQAGRLLPMMGLVLAASAIIAWSVRPAALARQTGLDLLAAGTFWENWRLAGSATDYLQAGADRSIVQHFWAMGVQGQWTLGAILVVGLVAVALRRRAVRQASAAVTAVLAVVAVASFAYALVAVATNPVPAYYDTAARAWELALGGLAALVGRRVAWSIAARTAVGVLGLVTLLGAGLMPAAWSHPGLPTLVPALAAVAVLLAGSGTTETVGVGRLLALRPLTWLGGISFGLYLWHWPFLWLAVERGADSTGRVGLLDGCLVLGAGIVAAWLSSRLLERARAWPARFRRTSPPWTAALAPVVALVGLVATVVVPPVTEIEIAEGPSAAPLTVDGLHERVASALAEPGGVLDGLHFGEAARNPEWTVDGCGAVTEGDLDRCRYTDGEVAGDGEVWLVGDSQAATWAPAVRDAMQDELSVQMLGFEMCPFASGPVVAAQIGEDFAESCAEHNAWIVELAAERSPALVIVSYGAWWVGDAYSDLPDETPQLLAESTGRYVAELVALGVPVLWLDSPPPVEGIDACEAALRVDDPTACASPLSEAQLERHKAVAEAVAAAGGLVTPTLDWFCDVEAMACPLVVEGVPVWADGVHMTWAQAVTLQPLVADALASALASSEQLRSAGAR